MDLLDQALENSQDKDGECSSRSSEAMIAAETCLVVDGGGREVLAMVDDDDDGEGFVSDDDEKVTVRVQSGGSAGATVLQRAPQSAVVVQSVGGAIRRGRPPRRGLVLHSTPHHSETASALVQDQQFEFQAENNRGGGGGGGTVTYRVVQVAPSSGGGGENNSNDEIDSLPQIISTTGNFTSATGTGGSGVQAVLTTSPLNGQFYVIGSPQDMFSTANARNIAPRNNPESTQRSTSRRDERRRATHNEVERRRRDKINNWIVKLGKIIPEGSSEQAKQGSVSFEGQSKGGILAKACEYIVELRTANQRMGECMKENERLAHQNESLRQTNEELRLDLAALRTQLQQHGITPVPSSVVGERAARDPIS